MKEKIRQVKKFVCLYASLPLFVFMVLVSGMGAMGANANNNKAKVHIGDVFLEISLFPSKKAVGEPVSPKGSYPIIAKDMSKDYDILNSTGETLDEEGLLMLSLPYEYSNDGPLVLVVHTHATESYADDSESFNTPDVDGYYGYYTKKSSTRTEDCEKNVVAVGEAFCKVLAENGIKTIQCRTLHDKDDYNSAYANSRKSIEKYLKEYPTIKYVIDLHRDSLGEDGSEKIKTVASDIDGCAQVMLVAGCQGSGVKFPSWKENLSVALKFKKAMDKNYPSLTRPIYLRYSRYNLDLTKGSMLLEVGTCSNTLEEAKTAAKLAAECFSKVLKSE